MAISFVGFIKGLLVQNEVDRSKEVVLESNASATTGTRTTITAAQTANRTITLPNATDTLVGKQTTDTLINKTLDNTTVLTIKDSNLTVQDNSDVTKQAKFEASGITAGQTRTFTLPDGSTTLVGTDLVQTVGFKVLDNTNSLTVKDTNLIVQDDGDATKQAKFQASSISAGQTRVMTIPDADLTIVGTATSQTLTNKTIDADANTLSNIDNADIKAAAAIAVNKLAALTASRAVVSDGSGFITQATTTATEIGYVNGVTSAIQTQMNLKAPLASPTFTGTVTTPVTASRALVTGASSELAVATTTATEIGYVNGVTSAIQTQLNTKAPSSSPTLTTPTVDVTIWDGQGSSPANPSAGFYKIYIKDSDGQAYILDSAGSENLIGTAAAGLFSTTSIAVNTALAVTTRYFCTAGGLTLTLPGSPANGDRIIIIDSAGNFATSPSTLARNGNNIMNLAADYTLEAAYGRWMLVFRTGIGWYFEA